MSIIKCNECGNDVSDKASVCPKCGAPIIDTNEKAFRIAIDQRDKEIELVWKRSNLFWLFTAGAFVAFYSIKSNVLYSVIVANVGLFCSLCWTLVNRGSKFWMNSWERWVSDYDSYGYFSGAHPEMETSWWASRFSMSKLVIAISDFMTLIWLVIIIYLYWSNSICLCDLSGYITPLTLFCIFNMLFFYARGKD